MIQVENTIWFRKEVEVSLGLRRKERGERVLRERERDTHSMKEVRDQAKATAQPLMESHSTVLTNPFLSSSTPTSTRVSLVTLSEAIPNPANPGDKTLLTGIPLTVLPVKALQSIAREIEELPPS